MAKEGSPESSPEEFDMFSLGKQERLRDEKGGFNGKFSGKGFIGSGEGSYLSSYPDRLLLSGSMRDIMKTNDAKYLRIAELFPSEWNGREVEYEITVKAKLVNPKANPRRRPPKS